MAPPRPNPAHVCALCGGLLVRNVQPRLGHVLLCTHCLETRRVRPDRSESQDALTDSKSGGERR